MSRSTIERLKDARSFAHDGEFRVLGLDRGIFSGVAEIKFTVYYCIIGIGEALKAVAPDLLESEPNIPWESIIGMRNRLVHTYCELTTILFMTSQRTSFRRSASAWKRSSIAFRQYDPAYQNLRPLHLRDA